MKILVIEDHPKIREGIIQILKKEQYDVLWVIHGEEALETVQKFDFDLLILDINMPVLNGQEFMKKFRKRDSSIPVIALTSNSMIEDKLEMFHLGCDDYITKPFDPKELLVRISALFKRSKQSEIQKEIVVWNIVIDIVKHKVYKENTEIILPRKQYLILEYLAQNKGVAKNKTEILARVWWEQEENLNIDSVTLESHISALRKRLWKELIQTHKWFWYLIP